MENKILLKKHISAIELKKMIQKEKDNHIEERLLFIHQLYFNDNLTNAYKRM